VFSLAYDPNDTCGNQRRRVSKHRRPSNLQLVLRDVLRYRGNRRGQHRQPLDLLPGVREQHYRRRHDDFSSFLRFFEPSQNFFSLAIDPSTSPPTAYAASDGGDIYVSTNRGVSFAATNLFNQPARMTLVSVTPSGDFAANFLENDATLTSINPAGTAFTFSTDLQGASQDAGLGVRVEPNGATIHVVGETASSDFPVAPSPGAVQTALAGLTDAFLTVFGPPMSQGGMVPTPPPPTNVPNGKPGGTVGAGSLTVNNTSGAPLITPSVTIGFDNADLFTSATLTATVGHTASTSTVVPATGTTFTFNPPVTIPFGRSVTYSLSATITTRPNITRRELPIAYASIFPFGQSREANIFASLIGLSCALALLTAGSSKRRLMFAAALVLLLVSVETGSDNGSIGGPSGAQFSTQTARDVAAENQTGGPVTIGGLPVVMSTITVP
jgi:hypothetical protein